ncbi:restriction endonuclease subunit S [Pseudoalteromonas sp. SR41-1]|uniref:restriction endonuclease subunit S n=1 Tax=Pseudoalteromonas sp. SR41-1 TaxID=2760952 RepID=UPI00160176C0|nr:restriction endonuclease subunit S [Pseudoalteromonas sp. SR41-1]MBB1279902.1 restriction endonuclease subunit S [Pseudoalteromonas sp. SR41-1]
MGSKYLMKIRDIAEVFDGPHATPKKIDVGPYFLSISSLVNGQLDLSKSAHLSEEQFKKWTKRVTPQVGDVLFSYETRLGEAALMPAGVTACLGRRMGLLRPDQSKVLPEYLLYAYLSPVFQQEIKKRTIHGATVERISLRELPDFDIHIPEIKKQRKVINTLNAINNKISLNKKNNHTLEQMAQALFKSWFVDFDPVFDNLLASVDFNLDNLETSLPDELKQKAQRRLVALNNLENAVECKASLSALAHELQVLSATKEATEEATEAAVSAAETPVKPNFNANPKILAQHANTHAHFPCEFEHNEQLGWIPKGWEGKSFKEVIDKYIDNRGKTPPLVNNGIPLIEVKHIPESSNFPSFKSEKQFSLETYNTWFRAHVEERDILISTVGTIGRTTYVKDTKFGIAQNILGLRFGKHVNPEYMFYYIKSHRFQYDMDARLITTVQASIKRKDLDTITILVPDGQIQNRFSEIINSILTQQFSKKLESEQLTKLRDTLLPKLISGELQIPDVTTDEEVVD